MSDNWAVRKNPLRLERRFEFDDYEQTRTFLERAADIAESEGYYPDMSFGRTHVNITLQPQDDSAELNEALKHHARQLDALVSSTQTGH